MATRHWFTRAAGNYTVSDLTAQIVAAGFPCEGAADRSNTNEIGLDLQAATLTGPQTAQIQAVVDAHPVQVQADVDAIATLKATIKANAQSAVGLTPDLWTTAQLKELVVLLLFESGGLNNDLTLKALNTWVDK